MSMKYGTVKFLLGLKKISAGAFTGAVMTDLGFHIYTGWRPDGLVSAYSFVERHKLWSE